MGLSLTGDTVTIEPLSQPPPYLQSLDVEVGFLKRNLVIAEAFSADEMCKNFVRAFSGNVFATGQSILFDFHGQNLRGTIMNVQIVELPNQRAPANYGVVMEKTDVNFIKAADSQIKLKSSAKK